MAPPHKSKTLAEVQRVTPSNLDGSGNVTDEATLEACHPTAAIVSTHEIPEGLSAIDLRAMRVRNAVIRASCKASSMPLTTSYTGKGERVRTWSCCRCYSLTASFPVLPPLGFDGERQKTYRVNSDSFRGSDSEKP
jgi:hypothetical protein